MKVGRKNNTGIRWREGSEEEKAKMREYQRTYKERNKDFYKKVRQRSGLKLRYGLALEDYEVMYNAQRGLCAICDGVNSDGKLLHVDHNHTTGEIRGLLCRTCNLGIGFLHDDPVLVSKALEYLK